MKLIERFTGGSATGEARMSWNDYLAWVNGIYGTAWGDGVGITSSQSYSPEREAIASDFATHVQLIYKRNGPIFALMAFRMALFSQVRWSYRQLRNGRGGDLFSTPELDILNEDPQLNVRMIQDVDLAGNFYGVREAGKIRRLRPDWVQVVANKPLYEWDAEVAGYLYYPQGPGRTPPENARGFDRDQVIHWMPQPDPEAPYRGMSWLTPVVREIAADNATTSHKLKFFENGATPNLVFKIDPAVQFEVAKKFKDEFTEENVGAANAYKALWLGGGADVTVVGKDLKELDFAITQGKGESRLASAARVPPVLVGFSEGLQAATYSNYGQARRGAADTLLHPLWVDAAAALSRVVPPPAGAQVWYDSRDIPFLREDAKDDAEIKGRDAQTIRTLVDAGYQPDTVVAAVQAGDWSRLEHTQLFSVQLQPAGSPKATPAQESSPDS